MTHVFVGLILRRGSATRALAVGQLPAVEGHPLFGGDHVAAGGLGDRFFLRLAGGVEVAGVGLRGGQRFQIAVIGRAIQLDRLVRRLDASLSLR